MFMLKHSGRIEKVVPDERQVTHMAKFKNKEEFESGTSNRTLT